MKIQLQGLALAVSVLMVTLISEARIVEVRKGKDGTLDWTAVQQPIETKPRNGEQPEKTSSTAANMVHYAVKHGGLFIASTVISQSCINPVHGAILGIAAGCWHAKMNREKLVDSVIIGATLGSFAGAGMTSGNDCLRHITLRTAHGAVSDMSSNGKMVHGALCGAIQGITEKVVPAHMNATTVCACAGAVAMLGMPKVDNISLPILPSKTIENNIENILEFPYCEFDKDRAILLPVAIGTIDRVPQMIIAATLKTKLDELEAHTQAAQ